MKGLNIIFIRRVRTRSKNPGLFSFIFFNTQKQ
nr:MAG TPA: hypothetical protein [Caudoviricetes sp.]